MINKQRAITRKKTTDLAIRIHSKKTQFTSPKFRIHIFLNNSAGRQNLDTKVPIPFPWAEVMTSHFPAMYPNKIITKHWTMAGYKFSMDTVAPVEGAVKLVELTSIDGNCVGIFFPQWYYLNRKQGFFPQLYFHFLCFTVYPLKSTAIFPAFKHAQQSSCQIKTNWTVNVPLHEHNCMNILEIMFHDWLFLLLWLTVDVC